MLPGSWHPHPLVPTLCSTVSALIVLNSLPSLSRTRFPHVQNELAAGPPQPEQLLREQVRGLRSMCLLLPLAAGLTCSLFAWCVVQGLPCLTLPCPLSVSCAATIPAPFPLPHPYNPTPGFKQRTHSVQGSLLGFWALVFSQWPTLTLHPFL